MTAPQLLAESLGQGPMGEGRHCFFCGASCDGRHLRRDWLKSSFTALSGVRCPRSEHVCHGCTLAMDSAVRMSGRDKPQKCWMYSWIITTDSALAYTKANLDELARACLNPPTPPFAIALADSGQKHQLYLTPVNHDRGVVAVCLETQVIEYRPADLARRLDLLRRIGAALGKPALTERPVSASAIRLSQYWRAWESLLDEWAGVWSQPLSRLGAWLCPGRERLQHEHPSDVVSPGDFRRGGVPPQAGGLDGPGLFG